jgi:LuxR family maltose regulon positive regulatory protein
MLLTALVNDLAGVESPFWLVLDDYYVIQNDAVHQAVGFLLENRPYPLHLAIATRADPPLPLSRLRAHSQMVELRLSDLRFSRTETSKFFSQVMDLNLTEEDIGLLDASTEGWIAGLRMAGLSMQGREDISGYIRSFSGENRYILDFLFDEVFKLQAPHIQEFLLKTSILDRFCASLCDAVSGQTSSEETLDSLERGNLFLISLDDQRRWYRYHNLFCDLLKLRLKQTYPVQIPLLHRSAAAWFKAKNDLENSIAHSLAAGDFEVAANVIEEGAQKLDSHNQHAMLTSWLDRLPRHILEKKPRLCILKAWGDYLAGQREKEEEWLALAEKAIEAGFTQDETEKQHFQGRIAAVRAMAALTTDDIPRALEMGQKALDLVPDNDVMRCEISVAMGAAYWALGDVHPSEQAFRAAQKAALKVSKTLAVPSSCYLGTQLIKQARLQDALAVFRDGLDFATLPGGIETLVAGFPHIKLGYLFRERNELTLAGQHLLIGLELCKQFGQMDVLTEAFVSTAAYHLAIGEIEKTLELLQRADQVIQRAKVDQHIICWRDEVRIKTWLANGDLQSAAQWAANSSLLIDSPLNYLHDLPHQNLARIWISEGLTAGSKTSQEKAASLLDRLLSAADQAGWVHEKIKFLVLQAINESASGSKDSAFIHLFEALILARPAGYMRVFLDEGSTLKKLLIELSKALHNRARVFIERVEIQRQAQDIRLIEEYITLLLRSFEIPLEKMASTAAPLSGAGSMRQPAADQFLVEPLSGRELDVLRLLSLGCPDKKIAEGLVISRETVHKHLNNIYGKLDVHSRTEAILRARQLGLLE